MAEKHTIVNQEGGQVNIEVRTNAFPPGRPDQVWLGMSLGIGLAAGVFTFLVALSWLGKLYRFIGLWA